MIGIDTNVLVRYLVQDEPQQAAKATKLMESFTNEAQGFISITVLLETTWVLERAYKVGRYDIGQVINTLLRTSALEIQDADQVHLAVRRFEMATCGFADCLLVEQGRANGCHHTVTFDKKALTAGMVVKWTSGEVPGQEE